MFLGIMVLELSVEMSGKFLASPSSVPSAIMELSRQFWNPQSEGHLGEGTSGDQGRASSRLREAARGVRTFQLDWVWVVCRGCSGGMFPVFSG